MHKIGPFSFRSQLHFYGGEEVGVWVGDRRGAEDDDAIVADLCWVAAYVLRQLVNLGAGAPRLGAVSALFGLKAHHFDAEGCGLSGRLRLNDQPTRRAQHIIESSIRYRGWPSIWPIGRST